LIYTHIIHSTQGKRTQKEAHPITDTTLQIHLDASWHILGCCTASYLVEVYTGLEGVDSSSSGTVGEEQERVRVAYALKLKWI